MSARHPPCSFFIYNPIIFFCLRVLLHPANVIKTRFQLQERHSLYASTSSTLRQTLRHEGMRGLYRGFGTSSLMLAVQQLQLNTYEYLRSSELHAPGMSESARNGIAAAIAVLVAQVIANPVDVVSQRLMVQGQIVSNAPMTRQSPPSTAAPFATGAAAAISSAAVGGATTGIPRVLTTREIITHVHRTHGLYGFYVGFFISCAQFIPSASLWWFSYPLCRDALLPHLVDLQRAAASERARVQAGGDNSRVALELATTTAATWPALSWLGTLCLWVPPARVAEVLAGSMASAAVAVALNPMDIIRTRVQVEGRSAIAVARHLITTEGGYGLWKGTSARIAMLMPQGAITVWAYEFVKRMSVVPSKDGAAPIAQDALR